MLAALGTAAGLVVALGSNAGAAVIANSACEARGVGLTAGGTTNVAWANPATTPCATKNATIVHLSLGTPPSFGLGALGVTTGVIRSKTTDKLVTHGNREQYNAAANVADVAIGIPGLLNIAIDGVRAQAQGSHHLGPSGNCFFGGTTYVGNVIVNGHTYVIGSTPTDLNLGLLGLHLKLNQETLGSDGVTERAVEVTSDLTSSFLIVIAEAVVGTGCEGGD